MSRLAGAMGLCRPRPVELTTVKAIRAANSTRAEGWRQEELLKIP